MSERLLPVPPALREWVSRITVASIDPRDSEQIMVDDPDHATTLSLRIASNQETALVVVGPRTRALYHVGASGPRCVKIRIQPGRARLVLGRSVRDLVDRAVSVPGLWGGVGKRLADLLAGAGSDPASEQRVLERLEDALLAHLSSLRPREVSRSELVHSAVYRRSEQLRDSAGRLNISERHLRNLFTEAVGVSPRQFARIDRVRTVLARTGRTSLAQLAAEAGYYDQSHMTAAFRQAMGTSPAAFFAGRLPAASSCSGPALDG
jgi:AraC-like DNA-binding protein